LIQSSVYIFLVILLYYRQWKYKLLIDDPVGRDGYLYEMAKKVKIEWYDRRRSLTSVVVNVVTMVSVCGYIHMLWGWKAAVLYAVFPLNVTGVAWNTGNYYMSTVLLCLAGMAYSDILPLSLAFHVAALNSTLLSLPFFAMMWFYPFGWVHIFPLITFLTGNRFKTGIKNRTENHEGIGIESGFSWGRLYHIPRVIGYYVYLSLYPLKLGFFHTFGKREEHFGWKWFWLSVLVCSVFGVWGLLVDWKVTVWWFLAIGVFSGYVQYGQFVTERYTQLANVFFCVLMSKFLPYELFLIVGTLYFCRSLIYIPAWKSNERLFAYSTTQFPECPENYVNLASHYIERKNSFSAIKPLLVAEKMTVGNKYGIWVDLANCYAVNGFFQKALYYTNKSLEEAPKDKIGVMTEQRNDLERRIYKMQRSNKELKKMGVI